MWRRWIGWGVTIWLGAVSWGRAEGVLLPPIQTATYSIEVIQQKGTLLQARYFSETHEPQAGRLLLLTRQQAAFAAFRILSVENEKRLFFLQAIKSYDPQELPTLGGQRWAALEKVKDLPFSQEVKEALSPADSPEGLAEAESKEALENSPRNPAQVSDDKEEAEASEDKATPESAVEDHSEPQDSSSFVPDSEEGMMIPYSASFKKAHSSLSVSLGLVPWFQLFSALGVRWGQLLRSEIFFNTPDLWDAWVLEGSFFFYKMAGVSVSTDAYTLIQPQGTLQYQLAFGEEWGLFGYGGLGRSWVAASTSPSSQTLAFLNTMHWALGVGGFYQIGPSWYLRAEAGMDFLGLSLSLKF